jgi:hypothetical protein
VPSRNYSLATAASGQMFGTMSTCSAKYDVQVTYEVNLQPCDRWKMLLKYVVEKRRNTYPANAHGRSAKPGGHTRTSMLLSVAVEYCATMELCSDKFHVDPDVE